MRAQGQLQVKSPFPAHLWPLVWAWSEAFRDRVADDGSPKTRGEFVDWQMARSGSPLFQSWSVWRGDRIGGLVTFERARPGDISGWTHALFERSFFGRQTSEAALTVVYDELYRSGIQTIRGEVFCDNYAIRQLAKRLGAREYRVPNATLRGGKPVNMVGLVLAKERFYAVSSAVSLTADPGGSVGGIEPAGEQGEEANLDQPGRPDPGPAADLHQPERAAGVGPGRRREAPQRHAAAIVGA